MIKETDLPDDWKICTLGEMFDFQKKSKHKAGEGKEKGDYKFFTSSNIQSKFIDEFDFEGEHLIFATGGHAGIHYCKDKFSASTDCFILKNTTKIVPKYIYYYLFGNIHLVEAGFKGAGLKHISKAYLQNIEIPIPPLPVQKKIAGILEKAGKLKMWRAEADKLTDEFLKSTFLEMFGDPVKNPKGWEKRYFNKVCQTRLGKMLDKKKQTGLHSKPYLRNANVQWKKIDLSSVFEMDFNDTECVEFLLRKGDILICEGGEIGRTAMWNNELPECYFQKALHRARPFSNTATPEFIVNLMFILGKYNGFRNFTSQSTIAHLTGVELKRFPIICPPLPLQQKFAAIVRQVEQMRQYQQESKAHIDDLFNALMQKAFKGELVA